MNLLEVLGKLVDVFAGFIPRPLVCNSTERIIIWIFGAWGFNLGPGVWPWIPSFCPIQRISLRARPADLYEKSCSTKDGISISSDGTVQWRVTDPWVFAHECDDGQTIVSNVVLSELQCIVGSHTAQDLSDMTSNKDLNESVVEQSNKDLAKYGICVEWFGITSQVRAKAIHLIGVPGTYVSTSSKGSE